TEGRPMTSDPNATPQGTPSEPPPPPPPPGAQAPGPPPAVPFGAPQPGLKPDERQWGMFAHLSALAGLVVGFWFIGPLVIWLMKKEESAFVERHAKEALNFQITMTIASIVAALSIFCVIGIVLLPLLFIANVILVIVAGMKANE